MNVEWEYSKKKKGRGYSICGQRFRLLKEGGTFGEDWKVCGAVKPCFLKVSLVNPYFNYLIFVYILSIQTVPKLRHPDSLLCVYVCVCFLSCLSKFLMVVVQPKSSGKEEGTSWEILEFRYYVKK